MKRSSRPLLWLMVLALLSVPQVSAAASVTNTSYEDLSGRFALNIPDGWKLVQEQFNMLYIFGKSGSSVKLILMYSDGVSDIAELFSEAVDLATGSGLTPPTPGSVADMTLNGSPARWAEYTSDVTADKKTARLHVYAGAVISPEHQGGISFFVSMSPKDYEKLGDPLRASWESLRLHGKPLTGAGEVAEVDASTVRIAKKTLEASVLEHKLITVSLPAGWASELGKDSGILAKLKHEKFGTLTIMGGPKNEFGKSRDNIINDIREALLSGMPTLKAARGSWTLPTVRFGDAALEQYEGAIVAEGVEIPHGALIAALKDGKRGVGFMAVFKSDVKDEAVTDLLQIIASAK